MAKYLATVEVRYVIECEDRRMVDTALAGVLAAAPQFDDMPNTMKALGVSRMEQSGATLVSCVIIDEEGE